LDELIAARARIRHARPAETDAIRFDLHLPDRARYPAARTDPFHAVVRLHEKPEGWPVGLPRLDGRIARKVRGDLGAGEHSGKTPRAALARLRRRGGRRRRTGHRHGGRELAGRSLDERAGRERRAAAPRRAGPRTSWRRDHAPRMPLEPKRKRRAPAARPRRRFERVPWVPSRPTFTAGSLRVPVPRAMIDESRASPREAYRGGRRKAPSDPFPCSRPHPSRLNWRRGCEREGPSGRARG